MHYTKQFCADVVAKGLRLGASDLHCAISQRKETSADAFDNRAQGTTTSHETSLYIKAFDGQRQATISTTDLSARGIEDALAQAVALAKQANVDPLVGLADPALYSKNLAPAPALDTAQPTAPQLVEMAVQLERTVRGVPGIQGTEGLHANTRHFRRVLVTSNGFAGETEKTSTGFMAEAMTEQHGQKVNYDDYCIATHAADLPDIAAFGRAVGQGALAKLKQGKLEKPGVMPIVLAPKIAVKLLVDKFAETLDAQMMAEGKTWIKPEHLDTRLAHPSLNIFDENNLPKGIGNRLFDTDGISGPARLALLEDGMLKNFMVGLRGARKSGLTANGRSQSSNLWLANGKDTLAALVADIKEGLYVTGSIGKGYTMLTGDLSCSVGGFIIRNGEITDTYVLAASIAGNMKDMLMNTMPANDLEMRYGTNAPSLRVEGMTVSGA